jgi:hypothetical protein
MGGSLDGHAGLVDACPLAIDLLAVHDVEEAE